MSNTTADQPVTADESTPVAKRAKRANVAKAAKRKKSKKKKGVPEIKFFITAAALTATIGGWAGMATSLVTTPSAAAPAPIAEQVVPSGQVAPSGQSLRPVAIPNASAPTEQVLRQATRPKPVRRTRSSR